MIDWVPTPRSGFLAASRFLVHCGPSSPFGLFMVHTMRFVAFLYVLGLALLLVGIGGFVTSGHVMLLPGSACGRDPAAIRWQVRYSGVDGLGLGRPCRIFRRRRVTRVGWRVGDRGRMRRGWCHGGFLSCLCPERCCRAVFSSGRIQLRTGRLDAVSEKRPVAGPTNGRAQVGRCAGRGSISLTRAPALSAGHRRCRSGIVFLGSHHALAETLAPKHEFPNYSLTP